METIELPAVLPKQRVKFAKTKAHQRYRTKDGKVVPGTTTVLGIIDKPQLLKWAWQCGMDGIDMNRVRDEAADIGTLAHFMVECHHNGVEADLSEFSAEQQDKATNAFLKFLEYWQASGFKMVRSEAQLVSELYRYGGTTDTIFKDPSGKLGIIDTKSNKAIYNNMWWQVAAYKHLVEENLGCPVERTIIVRIGKEESGDFEVSERALTARHWNVFRCALDLHNAIKEAD